MTPLFSRISGGLLHSNIAVCTLFGAVSGSSIGRAPSARWPTRSCQPRLSARHGGRLAGGGGTLGLLVPPSLSLLLYGALTDSSIGRLFLAGILPGFMIAAFFMAYIYVQNVRNPKLTPHSDERPTSSKSFWVCSRHGRCSCFVRLHGHRIPGLGDSDRGCGPRRRGGDCHGVHLGRTHAAPVEGPDLHHYVLFDNMVFSGPSSSRRRLALLGCRNR